MAGLKKAREEKGYTQKTLADKLHIGTATVSSWEQGRANPPFETLMKLAEELDCDLDYLTGGLDFRTHDNEFICEKTNLYEDAVDKLISLDPAYAHILSWIIIDNHLEDLLGSIVSYFMYHEEDDSESDAGSELDAMYGFMVNRNLFKVLDSIWDAKGDRWKEIRDKTKESRSSLVGTLRKLQPWKYFNKDK